jgi:hypothetical protein
LKGNNQSVKKHFRTVIYPVRKTLVNFNFDYFELKKQEFQLELFSLINLFPPIMYCKKTFVFLSFLLKQKIYKCHFVFLSFKKNQQLLFYFLSIRLLQMYSVPQRVFFSFGNFSFTLSDSDLFRIT